MPDDRAIFAALQNARRNIDEDIARIQGNGDYVAVCDIARTQSNREFIRAANRRYSASRTIRARSRADAKRRARDDTSAAAVMAAHNEISARYV